jgi:deazaflavin-dependent oxidoreductase (nitroreductase family)
MSVSLYRSSGGKIGGTAKGGQPVLILTIPGRKSGVPHSVPVGYVERDGAYYLAASAGGSKHDPQWIRNLRSSPTATMEIGRDRRTVDVQVLRGAERDAAWKDIIVAAYPFFADYATKSGRTIPVARIAPAS